VEKCRINIPSQKIDPEAWVDHVTALNRLQLIEEEERPRHAGGSVVMAHPQQQQQEQQRQQQLLPTPSTASTIRVRDWKFGLANGNYFNLT